MKVKEKKVELIELFYDLIYVYAISQLTLLIEEPEGGAGTQADVQSLFYCDSGQFDYCGVQVSGKSGGGQVVHGRTDDSGDRVVFIALYANSAYYYERHVFLKADGIASCIFVIVGAVLMFIGRESVYSFLLGVLIASGGNFVILVRKHKTVSK